MIFFLVFAVALFSGVNSQNNAYFPNNAYTHSNAYSQGNAYLQGISYAPSNAYPQNGAFMQGDSAAGSPYRPCPNFNTNCISQYFSRNSNCKIVNRQNVKEPFKVSIRQFELAAFNVSMTRYDSEYYGILSGKVEEFFVDYASGYTVLSVVFNNLTIRAEAARYQTNRRADIPLVEFTTASVSYPEVAITTVFPSSSVLNLAQARSSVYDFGTADVKVNDPNGVGVSAIDKNLPVAIREAFLTTAPLTARNYIQSTICDFSIGSNDLGDDR